jgi:hypothetical protein
MLHETLSCTDIATGYGLLRPSRGGHAMQWRDDITLCLRGLHENAIGIGRCAPEQVRQIDRMGQQATSIDEPNIQIDIRDAIPNAIPAEFDIGNILVSCGCGKKARDLDA